MPLSMAESGSGMRNPDLPHLEGFLDSPLVDFGASLAHLHRKDVFPGLQTYIPHHTC